MFERRSVKAKACFSIASGRISLEEISERTGIKFDRLLVQDLPNKSGKVKLNSIQLGIIDSKGDSEKMEEHIRDLLSRINPLRNEIKGLPEGCHAAISLNYFLEGNCHTGWSLEPDVMLQLVEMGVPCVVILKSNARAPKRRTK